MSEHETVHETAVESATLYERLGGEPAIAVVIDDLYARILDDPAVAVFFDGVALDVVKRHQRELVITAVGGPSEFEYSGRSMREAHAGLHIEQHHVARLQVHLTAALADAGVAETDAAIVKALIHRLWQAQFWPATNAAPNADPNAEGG